MNTSTVLLISLVAYLVWGGFMVACEMVRDHERRSTAETVVMVCAIMLIGPPISIWFGIAGLPRFIGWCAGRLAKSYRDGYRDGLYNE